MRLDRAAVPLALLALLAACGGEKAAEKPAVPASASPSSPSEAPPAFVAPDLSAVDAAVREQIEAARRNVDETAPQGGAHAMAWLRLGQLYHAYDLLDPAAAAYEQALYVLGRQEGAAPGAPASEHVRHGLALVRHRQGRFEDAVRLLRAELTARPSAAASYRLGQSEKAAGRPAEARVALTAARSEDLGCVAAGYELGLLSQQEGKLEEAVTFFEEALARQPSAVQVHFALGQALQRLGRKEEAQKHLEVSAAREVSVGGRAICADPFEAELRPLTTGSAAHITRGQAARFSGNLDQAIEEYRQAIEVAPDDPIAHQALGKALAAKGDLEGALAEYRKATQLDPSATELKVDLAILLEQKGDLAEAGRLYREALATNPALVAAHFGQARLALAAGQAGPALAGLAKVLELEPTNVRARGLRAELLMELKRPAEALEDVRHLLDQSPPQDPMEHASLAWAAAALGDKNRAFDHLRQIAGQSGANPKARAAAHYRLASLHLEKQDQASAKTELEAALAQDPTLEPARKMLDRLRP